jgi:flagellum-specific peptidoglycan hydrolase FlgJ
MFFKRAGDREAAYESKFKRETPKIPTLSSDTSKNKSSDGGLLSGIGSVFSGILGAGSSIVGGIFSGLGSIVGAGAKILGGATGILGGLGIGGIIVALAAGSLISSLYSGMDFAGIASSIGTVIDDVVKNIKNFFGFGENSDDKNFFEKAASYLDKAFNTSNFTDGLNSVVKKMQDITDDISIRAVRLYNDVMIATLASVQTIGDVFLAIGLDLKSSYLKWIDDNSEAIFATIGAAVGGAFGGPKGAAIGATAGVAYGFVKRKLVDEQRDTAVNDLQPQVANLETRIADLKKKNPNQPNPREAFTNLSLTNLQEMLDEKKSLLATKQTEIQERKGNNVSALTPEAIQKKIDERKQNLRDSGQFPNPTNTKPTPTTAPSSTGASSPSQVTSTSSPVAAYGGYKSRQDFTDAMMPYAQKAATELKVSPEAIISQWGLETGFGKAGAVQGQFNYGNIQGTYRESEPGLDSGKARNFIKYKSMDDFVDDYVKQLKNPRYANQGIGQQQLGDREFFTALKKGGYAEDANYVDKLTAIAEKQKGIKPGAPGPATALAQNNPPAKLPPSPLATLMASMPKAGSLLESLTGGYGDVLRSMQEQFAPNQTNITNNTVANAGQQGSSNIASAYDDLFPKLMERSIYVSA